MQSMTPELIAAAKARADAPLVEFFKREVQRLLDQQEEDVSRLRAKHPGIAPRYFAPLLFQGSTQEFASGGFIPRLGKLKNDDELDFILRMVDKSERVRWGMAYFASLKPDARLPEAVQLTKQQLCTGWQRLGIPVNFNQTVADHHRCGTALAAMLFPQQPDVAQCLLQNIGNAVIGDFTLHDDISSSDKAQLEALGVRLLTSSAECRGNLLAEEFRLAVEIYDGVSMEHVALRSKTKDCNLLGTSLEALHIMDCCPPEQKTSIVDGLQQFWTYVEKGLTHWCSRKLFEGLAVARYGLDVPAQEVWERAVAAVGAGEPEQKLYGEMIAARAKEWGDCLTPQRPPAQSPQAHAADFQPRLAT